MEVSINLISPLAKICRILAVLRGLSRYAVARLFGYG